MDEYWDTDELWMRCSQSELEVMALKGRLSGLESENAQPHKTNRQNLSKMIGEELIPKKRKVSKDVVARWEFYHMNKETVAKENKLSDWREIKRLCDSQFQEINRKN
jgi:hypothetical protein